MSNNTNPLDILKRLDVKQNVTIRVLDEATGKVVQEHIGHNAATNSLLTGIAHYLMGDGVLNQGKDTLSMWVPQYISLGTMGLTSQDVETLSDGSIVPVALGYTPMAPDDATPEEKELNAQLRFEEYLNQTPGFGADGYDNNANNNREWFGLGYPYSLKPNKLVQNFYTAGSNEYVLSDKPLTGDKSSVISVVVYPDTVQRTFTGNGELTTFPDDGDTGYYGFNPKPTEIISVTIDGTATTAYTYVNNHIVFNVAPDANAKIVVIYGIVAKVDQDSHNTAVPRSELSVTEYDVALNDNNEYILSINNGTTYSGRIAVIYQVDSPDATNCELVLAKVDNTNTIVPLTLRSKITYRDLVPEIQSEVPNTLDVIYSAMISTGALKSFRGNNDYIYITEAGLWSKPNFTDTGDNGLLAGYRLMPSDDEVNILGAEKILTSTGSAEYALLDDSGMPLSVVSIDSITADGVVIPDSDYTYKITSGATVVTFDDEHIPTAGAELIIIYRSGDVSGTWKDMTIPENREKVQKSLLRIGVNQVAQIIWKIQLGGLEQLNGLRYLYPPQYPEDVWELVTN